jgi:hypothetical protein
LQHPIEHIEHRSTAMTKIIEGVPETITRDDYTRLIESVGLDPQVLISLTFESEGIRARVVETDLDGASIPAPTSDDEFAVVTHDVFIRITDGPTA